VIRQPFRARTSEELIALLSVVATAILAFIIITTLYFGREIFVPIALAILLSSFWLSSWVLRYQCRLR
jgi:multisubunit Na+/H+ antiporter MnhF subunit